MSNKHEEWISKIAAANRLGESVETVEKLIKEKQLKSRKEQGSVVVSKESVYKYGGLSLSGHKTKNRKVLTHEEAVKILEVDHEVLQGLIRSGTLEKMKIDEGMFGVSERSVKQCKERSEDVKRPKMRTAMAKPIPGAIPVADVYAAIEGLGSQTIHGVATGMGLEGSDPQTIHGVATNHLRSDPSIPEERFSRAEMKDMSDISYKLGRLSVYESMSEFKRKETA